MRSFLEIASGDDEIVAYADWVEICTLFKADATVSQEDLSREIHRSGLASESRARVLASAAFDEIADRVQAIGTTPSLLSCYPFELNLGRDLVELKQRPTGDVNGGLVYLFLLSITRASMHASHRTFNSIDATAVFERMCADVLLEFWSERHSDANGTATNRVETGRYIVGTARTSSGSRHFPGDVNDLCLQLGDGLGWNPAASSPGAGDGGVDLAVWTRFRDGRSGGLVGFAQCKTGDNWREHLGKHPTRAFSTKYFRKTLILDPIKIYMVPCRISEQRWDDDTVEANGLLFDRCRITQYANKFDPAVVTDCREWFDEAMKVQTKTIGGEPTMTRRIKRKK